MKQENWFAWIVSGIGIVLIVLAVVIALSSCCAGFRKRNSCGDCPTMVTVHGRPGGITGMGRR